MPSPHITLLVGDITDQRVDAIVNAANSSLLGGAGVDGAIHRRGGPRILEECKRLRADSHPNGLPVGDAVATTAGDLPASWVIHTVGPRGSAADRARLLAACHQRCLQVADEVGARSVAFPAISTGIYGYPVTEAASIALETVASTHTRVADVRFVLFDQTTYDAFAAAWSRLDRAGD
ncbi:MAG: O-acetyl-ADP-ribose deacetylase [Actinomycetota bacterium]|nr:O-acetyl-ADP-ribose deacetylase [Actinomycetota bacterium]